MFAYVKSGYGEHLSPLQLFVAYDLYAVYYERKIEAYGYACQYETEQQQVYAPVLFLLDILRLFFSKYVQFFSGLSCRASAIALLYLFYVDIGHMAARRLFAVPASFVLYHSGFSLIAYHLPSLYRLRVNSASHPAAGILYRYIPCSLLPSSPQHPARLW